MKTAQRHLSFGWAGLLVLTIALFCFSAAPVQAADSYQISFKGGSHGTISYNETNEGVSYDIEVPYQSSLDTSQVRVVPEDGWYCTGWSPEVESPVTEKATYVAQYKRIIDEAVYRVNYVDTSGNALATQAIRKTNAGVDVTEYAVPVDGYAVDSASKTATVAKEGTEITFTYQSAQEPSVVDQVENVVIPGGTTIATTGGVTAGTTAAGNGANAVTAGGTGTAGNAAAGNAGTDGAAAADGTTDGTVNQQGQTTTVDDNNVPLANQQVGDQKQMPTWGYIAIIAGAALIAGSLITLLVKRRKKKQY